MCKSTGVDPSPLGGLSSWHPFGPLLYPPDNEPMSAASARPAHTGLEPVLTAPIERPTAVAWCPRSEVLWVGSPSGLHIIDRVMGVQSVGRDVGTPTAIAVSPDGTHAVVVNDHGLASVVQRHSASVLARGKTGLVSRIRPFVADGRVYVVGQGTRGMRLLELMTDGVHRVAKLPAGATAGSSRHGPVVGRVLGGHVVLSPPDLVDDDPSDSGYILRMVGPHMLGWTSSGVCAWVDGRDAVTARVRGITACDLDEAGNRVALGTKDGDIAVVDLMSQRSRREPTLVATSSESVRHVRFSAHGPWLAAVGSRLVVWTTEVGARW